MRFLGVFEMIALIFVLAARQTAKIFLDEHLKHRIAEYNFLSNGDSIGESELFNELLRKSDAQCRGSPSDEDRILGLVQS